MGGGEEEKGNVDRVKYRKIAGRRVPVLADAPNDDAGDGKGGELKSRDELVRQKKEDMQKKSKNSKGHKGGKGGAAASVHDMKIKGRAKFSKGNHMLKGTKGKEAVAKPKGTPSAPLHGKNRKQNQKRSKVNLANTKYTKGKQGQNPKGKKSGGKGGGKGGGKK